MNFHRLPGLQLQHLTPPPARPLRLDVPVFVGVAPRGPAREPVLGPGWPADAGMVHPLRPRLRSVAVPVDGLDSYRRLFGEVEAGAYLGRAVATFFAQGGRRCWVMRIVSRSTPAPSARAQLHMLQVEGAPPLPATLGLVARNEGAWGNTLQATLALQAEAAPLRHDGSRWLCTAAARLPVGSLLRWREGAAPWQLTRVEALVRERSGAHDLWVPGFDSLPGAAARVELLTVQLRLGDGLSVENHSGLGLDPRHPRWLAAELCRQSQLVWPAADWAAQALQPADATRLGTETLAFTGGADAFEPLTPDDFFDPLAPDGFWREEPDPDQPPGEGIDALRRLDEPAMLVVPDLYHPLGLERDAEPVEELLDAAGAAFAPCRPGRTVSTPPPPVAYPGLQLDPLRADELQRIVGLQQRLVAFAAHRATSAPLLALLDVPPGLSATAVMAWRRQFEAEDSPDTAAYAPWLLTTAGGAAAGMPGAPGRLVPLPPSAAAAGVIAAREAQDGLPFGPAQRVLQQVVMPRARYSPAQADALHTEGINLSLLQAEGVVLMGARSFSRNGAYRALASRRVVHWLLRWLQREAPWLVFEPLNPGLVEDVNLWLQNLLRRLWRGGALRGNSESEAFFVRVAAEPRRQAELLVDIGLALAEPLEFIVVRLSLADDGLRLAPAAFAAAEV
ncbi:hypothetical protein [Rubrivivax rivuli]|uniref:Tail sheath protein C-terminal domain-containing protein n=1 Tax=Rubrivivax rivuli TaxID=1862385 RepID=A0A437RHK4_9BURK|nr:hypothetical protein [Rubrivivax rivuli]RVU46214.1 hypothetical protein EOE66_10175 [Rubrivivax rivuli]